ncbi:MAG: type II toxin-antitoxin system PemK/MazF family toxin [Pirellulaceae bacterium]
MNVQRGEVVLLDFLFPDGSGAKNRPAVVIQADNENRRVNTTIVAMVTTRIHRAALEPTQVYVDIAMPDGKQTGLNANSVVNAINLVTISKSKIYRVIGQLSVSLMAQVDKALLAALEL